MKDFRERETVPLEEVLPAQEGAGTLLYLLTMFPYPSGDLHMGHAEVFSLQDAAVRFQRARGRRVLNPIGWDSFGLPAENAAIARGESPAVYTYENVETQAASLRRLGTAFSWDRRFHTSDPSYYRWSQWLFKRLFQAGLAYRRQAPVNWCPVDHTVVANEQVSAGACERCGTPVEVRSMDQWYLRLTDYAEELATGLQDLEGWAPRVRKEQEEWIGRTPGYASQYRCGEVTLEGFSPQEEPFQQDAVLLMGPAASEVAAVFPRGEFPQVHAFAERLLKAPPATRLRTLFSTGREALGETGARLPIVIGMLTEDGATTTTVVPREEVLPLLPLEEGEALPAGAAPGEAPALTPTVRYRLRDWLVSRQRYWGCPIPLVHCPSCGVVAVEDEDLPVLLPPLEGDALIPRGRAPLENAEDWCATSCPSCGGPARRDTDTLDTFFDSSWYFLRYCDPSNEEAPFSREKVEEIGPPAMYLGGAEHSTGHLLFARFFVKALADLRLISHREPFLAVKNQGLVLNGGAKMSKSKGNGVALAEVLDAYGSDATRLSLLFAGPLEDAVDWATVNPAALVRFCDRLQRVAEGWRGAGLEAAPLEEASSEVLHRAHLVTRHVEEYRYNVAIAELMTALKDLERRGRGGPWTPREGAALKILLQQVSIFAPYAAKAAWEEAAFAGSPFEVPWPEGRPREEEVTLMRVQVNGKVRGTIPFSPEEEESVVVERGKALLREGESLVKVVAKLPAFMNLVVR